MSVLIIGCGLVGSQIARLLVERGEEPLLLDLNPRLEALATIVDPERVRLERGSVLDRASVERLIREEKVEKIIHTAANPMLTSGAQRSPYDAIELNIMGTANVLEAARTSGVRRVVLTSSSVLYYYLAGGVDKGKIGFEDAYPRTSTIYSSTKLACENIGMNYADLYGLGFVAVRFTAVFGPWPIVGGGSGTQAFKEVIESSLAGRPATLSIHGSEFVYSKDAARGALLACDASDLRDRVFNISMGKLYSPEEVRDVLERVIPGSEISLEKEKRAGGGLSVDVPVNLDRARNQLGFVPQYDMEEAITDYVNWYRENGRPP
jgi:nucleoside-diphosphate-sugar epimerase